MSLTKHSNQTRFIAFVFSVTLFSVASFLFIRSAMNYTQNRHTFLKEVNLSGFAKMELNDQTQYLYLQPLKQDSNSIFSDIINKETGFKISRLKSYTHHGKTGSRDHVAIVIAEAHFDANGSPLNSKPQKNLYVFFLKNFKIQSAQRITSVNETTINLEFGSLKKYNPQFAEGTFQVTENIEFN